MEATIVSETIKYSDGTEKVVNFTDTVDQSIPEQEVQEEVVEEIPAEPVEETPSEEEVIEPIE